MPLPHIGTSIFIIITFLSCLKSANCEDSIKKVCFGEVCVNVEIADSEAERAKGLMFRESLPDNSGMLFVFADESKYGFWMKNMNFPLDIIWVGRDKKVIDISRNVSPCGSSCEGVVPREKAMYVLEANAGFIEANQIKIGEQAYFK